MKERIVEKCPACGSLRNAADSSCPACGYDYTDTGTSVINNLNASLEKLGSAASGKDKNYEKAIRSLIDSFHIPQVKREIFDLMLFLQPKATDEVSEYAPYWRRRQREVIERAKFAFSESEEPDVYKKIISYESELDILDKKNNNLWRKLPLIAKIGIVAAVLLLILMLLPAKDISPEAYSVRFSEAVEKGKWDKAMDCLENCPNMGTAISDLYLTLIDGLLSEDRVMEAANLYADVGAYVPSGNMNAHLTETTASLRQKFIGLGRIDEAQKYAKDVEGITDILKAYISSGQDQTAINYYKSVSSSLHKYDFSLHRRVFLCEDDTVISFLNRNGIKTE